MRQLALVSLFTLAQADASHAQAVAPPATTSILPDVAPERSFGTTISVIGKTSTIDGGILRGTNLFHSFSTFDLASGDVARWEYSGGDPTRIQNVINRITGGEPSSIYGSLDSTAIPSADFFFINPAGIIFGQGAQVNVPSAAHFSTASELRFASGEVLRVSTPAGSTLSMASPQAFGFLGHEGGITLSNVSLSGAPIGENAKADALTFSGTSIRLSSARLGAEKIALSAVGDGSIYLPISAEAAPVLTGMLIITESLVSTVAIEGKATEALAINAGTAVLVRSRFDAFQSFAAGNTTGILVRASDMSLIDSVINHYTQISFEDASDDNTGIRVLADNLTLRDSSILSNAVKGYGGNIGVVVTGHFLMTDSMLGSFAEVQGNSGTISIRAGSMDVLQSSLTSSASGFGDGGSIELDIMGLLRMRSSALDTSVDTNLPPDDFRTFSAGNIFVQAGALDLSSSRMSSAAVGSEGLSGTITVATDALTMKEGSVLSTSSENSNPSGLITIYAREILLSGPGVGITSSNAGTGDAGNIIVQVSGGLTLREGAAIKTVATSGAAGNISLAMAPISILSLEGRQATSSINTSVLNGEGAGGVITISKPFAIISNGGSILALGETGGANVLIDTSYFINSTDRENVVDVDGTLSFTNSIYDVSSGTIDPDLTILDASAVLRGQCGTVRASGTVSQPDIRSVGPFVTPASSEALRRGDHLGLSGGCH